LRVNLALGFNFQRLDLQFLALPNIGTGRIAVGAMKPLDIGELYYFLAGRTIDFNG
jgi:hypothetical protein